MRLEAILPSSLRIEASSRAGAGGAVLGGPIHPRIPRMLADQREEEGRTTEEEEQEEEEEVGENGDRPHGPLIAFHTHTLYTIAAAIIRNSIFSTNFGN